MTKEEYDYLISVKDTGTDIEQIQAAVLLNLFPDGINSRVDFADGIQIIQNTMKSKIKELAGE